MGLGDDLIAAISRIHAAGLDAEKWPDALSLFTQLMGGHGASLEFLQRPSMQHRHMYSYGLPSVGPYLQHYAPMCPRVPFSARHPAGTVQYDAQYMDDVAMDANPFYMEFLAPLDMRYFIGGVVASSPEEMVATGVQIAPKAGHPSPAKIKLMGLLLPHFQQAVDVMRRLGKLANDQQSFERALDWLADGVIMLAADGTVRYANAAAQEVARARDGIAIRRAMMEFASGEVTLKFGTALAAITRLREAEATAASADFTVERASGAAPYSISLRPLPANLERPEVTVALMFIHDPQARGANAAGLLQQAFGLTRAEAAVAQALRSGSSPDDYARERNLSPNTVYTHLRRIKEKTGCSRMAELIRKLNDVQVAAVAKR
jgi:DNA-binding CsgD family transcriptional regulator